MNIGTNYIMDLMLHSLAQFKVNNASDLYSEDYLKEIEDFRGKENHKDLDRIEISRLNIIYNDNFNELDVFNFIGFVTDSLDDAKKKIIERLDDDYLEKEFVDPFFNIIYQEDKFYKVFWKDRIEKNKVFGESLARVLKEDFKKLTPLYDKIDYKSNISLQISMTRYGRATYHNDISYTAMKYPESEDEVLNSFLQFVHETSHYLTDGYIDEIRMDDGTHSLSEEYVIYGNYLLFRDYHNHLLEYYCQQHDIDVDGKFIDDFKIDKKMKTIIEDIYK